MECDPQRIALGRLMKHQKKHLSLALKVILSIVFGIVLGLILGPSSALLKPIGDGYILLMETAVVPYIASSLIHGLGTLNPSQAKKMMKRCGWFLLLLWGIAFVFIYAVALLMPNPAITVYHADGASHLFSQDFFSYLIPKNPFYDLANNIVPAIAIFGLILGISLIFIPQKKELLALMERVDHAMEKLLLYLAKLAPISIISHLAYAFGTVDFEQLITLELYVISYVAIALFLVFITIPIIMKGCLHISFKEIFHESKTIGLVAFATGSPSVALPFIHSAIMKLTEGKKLSPDETHSTIQTVIPIGYTFAQIGNSMVLFFLLFLSFFYRQPFLLTEKALISLITIPLSIGAAPASSNAMSFLINKLNFPEQAIDLFNEATAVTDHFQVLCSVMAIFAFSLLALFSFHGILRWQTKKLIPELVGTFAILFCSIGLIRYFVPFEDRYNDLYYNLTIQEVIDHPVTAKIVKGKQDWLRFKKANQGRKFDSVLSRIMERGVLRVGYDPENTPFSYWNDKGQLVGYDVANAYQFARDLDCKLAFYPVDYKDLIEQLDLGYFDIVMSSFVVDEERLVKMDFSKSHDQQKNILMVPAKHAAKFLNYKKLSTDKTLRIGALTLYKDVAQRHFPLSTYVQITDPLQEKTPLTEGKVDAIISSYQYGLVWCLNHPGYVVIDFEGLIGKKYFSYPVKRGEDAWVTFVNDWLYLKYTSKFEERQKEYWLQGIQPEKHKARKSLIHHLIAEK